MTSDAPRLRWSPVPSLRACERIHALRAHRPLRRSGEYPARGGDDGSDGLLALGHGTRRVDRRPPTRHRTCRARLPGAMGLVDHPGPISPARPRWVARRLPAGMVGLAWSSSARCAASNVSGPGFVATCEPLDLTPYLVVGAALVTAGAAVTLIGLRRRPAAR